MTYLIPLMFSLMFSHGISNLLGEEKKIYLYLGSLLLSCLLWIIYRAVLMKKNRPFNEKTIFGTVVLSSIFTLMTFISSTVYLAKFTDLLAIFIGAGYFGYILFELFDEYIQGVDFFENFNSFKIEFRKILNLKLFDYVGLYIPVFLMFSWLLLENHGAFGDEPAKFINLYKTVLLSSQHDNLFYKIKVFYLFDMNYPPLFFILSSPFLYYFRDWVLGGRVFILFLAVISVITLFYFLKRHLGRMPATLGAVLLIASTQFIRTSREYALEILLVAFLLLLLVLMSKFLETNNRFFLFAVGVLIALGLLTKYNFAIYAMIPTIYYLSASYRKNLDYRKIPNDLILLSMPSLLLAGPWFFYTYVTHPVNTAIGGYLHIRDTGLFETSFSLLHIFSQIWENKNYFFSDYVYLILALMALVFLIMFIQNFLHKRPRFENFGELVVMPVSSILFLSVGYEMLGLTTPRWNMSYVFAPLTFAYLFGKIFYEKKIFGMIVAAGLYCVLIFGFVNIAIRQIVASRFFQAPADVVYLVPSDLTTGAKESALMVKNDMLKNNESLDKPVIVGFIGHIHAGLHGHALAYYGITSGIINWQESNTGLLNADKPTDLSIFVNTDYLIYIPQSRYNYEHPSFPSSARFQWIIENAPLSYAKCLKRLGEVTSRFGNVVTLKVDRSCLTPATYMDLINIGKEYDAQQPVFLLFWNVEELKYQYQLLLTDDQVSQTCKQIDRDMDEYRDKFSAFYLDLILKDLPYLCGTGK